MRRYVNRIVIVALIIAIPLPASAQISPVVTVNYGTISSVTGEIMKIDDDVVLVRVSSGNIAIPKSSIKSITDDGVDVTADYLSPTRKRSLEPYRWNLAQSFFPSKFALVRRIKVWPHPEGKYFRALSIELGSSFQGSSFSENNPPVESWGSVWHHRKYLSVQYSITNPRNLLMGSLYAGLGILQYEYAQDIFWSRYIGDINDEYEYEGGSSRDTIQHIGPMLHVGLSLSLFHVGINAEAGVHTTGEGISRYTTTSLLFEADTLAGVLVGGVGVALAFFLSWMLL